MRCDPQNQRPWARHRAGARDRTSPATIRVSVTQTDDEQCVTVIGRAFRLTALRSEAPSVGATAVSLEPVATSSPLSVAAGLLGGAPSTSGQGGGAGIEIRLGPTIGARAWSGQFQLALSYVSDGFELPLEFGVGGDTTFDYDDYDDQFDETGHEDKATLSIMPAGRVSLARTNVVHAYVILGGGVIMVPKYPLFYVALRAGVAVDFTVAEQVSLTTRFTTDVAPVSFGEHHADPFKRNPVIVGLTFGGTFRF